MITDITLIVAIIPALSAVIASSVAAILTYIFSYKLKTIDLIYNSKLEAYKNFIESSSMLTCCPSEESLLPLYNAATYAMLFSSPHTQEKLSVYSNLLINPPTQKGLQELSIAYQDALLSMKSELYDFRHYRKHYKVNKN